jgi:homoserine kinase type II
MAVVGMCTQEEGVNLHKTRALIDGYQRIRKLEPEEKGILQLSIEYAAIATSSWRFWKYNIDTPIAANSQAYTQMVKIAKNINDIPKTVFQRIVFDD